MHGVACKVWGPSTGFDEARPLSRKTYIVKAAQYDTNLTKWIRWNITQGIVYD